MRHFKWIEWNLSKIESHGLSEFEVEAAIDRVFTLSPRADGSFEMYAEAPSGRRIWVIWRYDKERNEHHDVLAELEELTIFVITAY